jgi:CHAT domain-containing protein
MEDPQPAPETVLAILEALPTEHNLTEALRQRGWTSAAASQRVADAADLLVHQDTPQALRLAQAALAIAEQAERPEAVARALRSVVQGMALLGEFEAALPLSLRAYDLYHAAGLPVEATRTLLGRTHLLASLGQYEAALATGRQAQAAFAQAGEDVLAAIAGMNLGNIFQRLDQYHLAREQYEQARPVFSRLEAAPWLAQADFNLANALTHLNQPQAASQAYARARAFFDQHAQTVTVAMLDCNVGFLELRRCRYASALQQFNRARQGFEALKMHKDVVQMEMEIANTYLDLNLLADAAGKFELAAATFSELGLRYEAACAWAQLALTHIRRGRFRAAEQALDEARLRFGQEANQVWLQTCQLYTALLHQAQGELDAAAAVASSAAEGLTEAGLEGRRAAAYLIAAGASTQLGQAADAERYLEAAAQDLASVEMPTLQYHLGHWRGRLRLAQGEVAAALHALDEAMQAAERVHITLPGEMLRIAYREDKLGAYQAMAGLLLAPGPGRQVERAFSVIERAKALALVERLDQGAKPAPKSPEVARELESLRANLNWYYSAYTDSHLGSTPADRAALRQDIRAAERDLEELLRRHTVLSSDPFAAGTAAVIPLAAAQARLAPNQALLEYFIVDDEVLAMVISARDVRVFRGLTQAGSVARIIDTVRGHFQRFAFGAEYAHRHMRQLQQSARIHLTALYETLLAPLASELPDRLIIVPHGVLHYVPFQALYSGEHYLVERHLLSLAPSATVWAHCQAQPALPVTAPVVVAVSDPSIPYAAAEAEMLRQVYPQARVLRGPDATWANLQQHAAGADLLHVASHAIFRSDNAAFSALQLADGLVTVNDLAALRLRPVLVMLTGCETGVSRVAPGDELMGLGRALLGAGAATLAVSAWAVHDESAAQWVSTFYSHLRRDPSPAAAMRTAQLALMADHPHPYYWAPFSIVGRA